MKYTLYYAHAKLKAVKGKSLRGNTGIVHFSIEMEPLKKNIQLQVEKKTGTRGAASGDIFARHLAAHQRIWN